MSERYAADACVEIYTTVLYIVPCSPSIWKVNAQRCYGGRLIEYAACM